MTILRSSFLALAVAFGFVGDTLWANVPPSYVNTSNKIPSKQYDAAGPIIYNTPSGQFEIKGFFDVFPEIDLAPPPLSGSFRVDSFFDVFTELTLDPPAPSPALVGIMLPNAHMSIHTNGGSGNPATYDTEMLQLDLTGGGLPAGVMVRESPTLASTGQTTIQDIGGGLFRISSFFDVFTELSLDGGQTWAPGNQPLHLVGSGAPEPSSLVLLALGGALIGCRAWRTRRTD